MKKLLGSLLLLLTIQCAYTQDYAYSFNGSLSPEKADNLKQRFLDLKEVTFCDVKYKPDSQKGEILFHLEVVPAKSDTPVQFSVVQLKTILIQLGLEPIDFREIKH